MAPKTHTLILLALLLGISLIVVGCQTTTPTTEAKVICNKPYIQVGRDCCLDKNNNSICDNEETEETIIQEIKPPVCNEPYIQINSECCLDQNNNKICDNNEKVEPESTKQIKEESQLQLKECSPILFDQSINLWFIDSPKDRYQSSAHKIGDSDSFGGYLRFKILDITTDASCSDSCLFSMNNEHTNLLVEILSVGKVLESHEISLVEEEYSQLFSNPRDPEDTLQLFIPKDGINVEGSCATKRTYSVDYIYGGKYGK